eukprot:268797-Pleurochrysis_carterae.AAC.1
MPHRHERSRTRYSATEIERTPTAQPNALRMALKSLRDMAFDDGMRGAERHKCPTFLLFHALVHAAVHTVVRRNHALHCDSVQHRERR